MMRRFLNYARLALVLAASIGAVGSAFSQDYPARPVRLICPFPPGGTVDTMARVTAHFLGERLGQTVIVENRPGAGSMIGTDAGAKAAPDGYTLLMGSADGLSVLPAVRRNLPYDPLKDFTPLMLVARQPVVLVAHPGVPAHNIGELIALAKAKPGSIRFGSAGNGSMLHLVYEMLKVRTGIDIGHVPFKGGAPSVTEAVAGRIELSSGGITTVASQVAAGNLRALAVTGETRNAQFPLVQTVIESGVPDFVAMSWFGVFGPANLPAPVTARLARELVAVSEMPAFRQRMLDFGAESSSLTGEAFAGFVRADLQRWRQVVEAAKIKED
jgi:tripartite-type tricarboxylate transporter receptor subunit TctC